MTPLLRQATHRYEDPLSAVWIRCAARLGFRIQRSTEVYASTDGRDTIFIGTDELLDPDDCLGQMIFHELCHALVEGDSGRGKIDWGLDNTSRRDIWREQACLRVQAYLAGTVGLREFFAPTTDFRVKFWEGLGQDPFAAAAGIGGNREPSCVAARIAAWRADREPWRGPLKAALEASAAIAQVLGPFRRDREQHLGKTASAELPSLWDCASAPPPPHPLGHSVIADYHRARHCAQCAWSYPNGRGHSCRHVPGRRLPDPSPACARWEPAEELDCRSCGACCREAYHSVEISRREPLLKLHPELVVNGGTHLKLRRTGERCIALAGGLTALETYSCEIYEDRPRTCREFTRGSAHCLDARRRVGLSL